MMITTYVNINLFGRGSCHHEPQIENLSVGISSTEKIKIKTWSVETPTIR